MLAVFGLEDVDNHPWIGSVPSRILTELWINGCQTVMLPGILIYQYKAASLALVASAVAPRLHPLQLLLPDCICSLIGLLVIMRMQYKI